MKKLLLLFFLSLILLGWTMERDVTIIGEYLVHIDEDGDTTLYVDSLLVKLYRNSTVNNAVAGKPIILYRDAAEGTDSIIVYIDEDQKARIIVSGDTLFLDDIVKASEFVGDLTGTADTSLITKDSVTLEQWIGEERVDTIYAIEVPMWGNGLSRNIGAAMTAIYYYIDADEENCVFGLQNLGIDSARIDSVEWDLYTNDSDEDTLKFGYLTSDGVGDEAYTVNSVNQIEYNNSGWAYQTNVVILDVLITKGDKNIFPYVLIDDISFGDCRVLKLLVYSHTYRKRYGIP